MLGGSFVTYDKISDSDLREHSAEFDSLDWYWISRHKVLSEELIREFQDKVDWFGICIHQKISAGFIAEFKDKVWWKCIAKYQTKIRVPCY